MIRIERVALPYTVTIAVHPEHAKDGEWYNRLRDWLMRNIDRFEIEHSSAEIVAVNVPTEQDALLLKVAYDSDVPLPEHLCLRESRRVDFETVK